MRLNKVIIYLILAGVLSVPSCEPDKKMLVETGNVSNISTTTADVTGTIIDVGEGATEHGHVYGTSAGPLIGGSKTSLGAAVTGNFTSNISGLQPETKYYVRAYASLGAEAAYGSEINFTTASAALPELTTTAITSITKNSAVSGGNITSEGGTPVTAKGVCWNVASGPTTANNKTTDGTSSGSFASSLTGLSANTVYYVRAYATNAGGTAYGDEMSFTTSPEVAVAPIVTTAEVTSITSNSAVSGGDVTNEGGAPVTAKGVCWSTTANPTITSSKTTNGTGSGGFVSNLTNLNPGTTYYVRAYATNSAGTSYGNEYSFKTSAVVPTLTTIEISSATSTTASSGGNITSDGGSTITARGVCWSTSQNPTTADAKTNDGLGSGAYTSSLTGLIGNTTYYVRAYATNSVGTAYGDEKSFNTGAIVPTLTTVAVTSITSTTATSGGEISSDGGSSVTAKGVCWSTTANPTTADSKTSDGTGADPFTSSITGLIPGATYHVRAYATNSIGTAYGNDVSFTTSTVIPTVTTSAITNIASTTATSGGNVTSDGGADITARGVCWSTTANPTTDDSKTDDGTGTGSFTSNITGLTAGATYYVRAYATSTAGTAFGNELTFTTSTVPGAPTIGTATAGDAQATVTFTPPASDGGSAITGYTVTSSPGDITGTGSASPVTVTGLTNGTAYTFTVTATNVNGTGPASSATNSVTPSTVPGAPTSISAAKGDAQASVTFTPPASDGGSAITGYTATSNPGSFTGTSTTSPVTVTGLTNGTAYTFTVTATNAIGTGPASSASNPVTPSTVPGAPTIGTATAGNTLATVTFTAPASDGGSAITGYTVTSNPGSITGTGTASPITVTGLTNGTAYTFTVTATNVNGTGPASAASNSVTPATVPGAPTNVSATKGNAQATVTFTAPDSDGGSVITGYTVTSSPGGFTGTGNVSPVTVIGLTNGIAYTFTVTATNVNGTGPASAASNSVTPSTVPGAPTIGIATAGNAQATVTFTAPDSDGGSAITGYTVTSNPGSFTGTSTTSPITVTGLTNETAYTFTVTATNANGTGPASSASNSVIPSAPITDIDGNVYNTVYIGNQLWMKENLKTTHYNNGTEITLITDNAIWFSGSSGFCWYNNDETTYKNIYGAIYQWGPVQTSILCPSGWHVPTDTEWTVLTDYLIDNGYGFEGSGSDIAKSVSSNYGWTFSATIGTPGNDQTSNNTCGFFGLPGAGRSCEGTFGTIGNSSSWWTSTESSTDQAWYRYVNYTNPDVVRGGDFKDWVCNGRYVRCIKD